MWSRLKLPSDPTDGQDAEAVNQILMVYVAALSDLGVERLSEACKIATQRARFFPKPADIRDCVTNAMEKQVLILAEDAWQRSQKWIHAYWHPDVGYVKGAPQLEAEIEYAMRAAGGIPYLWSANGEALMWAKKRFVESFVRVDVLQSQERLLSSAEAKNILATARAGAPRAALSLGAAEPEHELTDADRAAIASGLEKHQASRAIDFDARKKELDRQKAVVLKRFR
jgi:hypothetical protein